MESFRTELENPIVQQDIIDLEKKIHDFREGKLDPEKFRGLRLARGVYGQRQPGVQMVRIKIPYGKLTSKQILRIADVSDEYSTGNLHLTTRQDIQLHFISLERTPQLWRDLERDELTLREACGNTVRNVTASSLAGIDPLEPFDVTPYADALAAYFLRHPVGQDLGRKIKIAFSSSEADTAVTFIHDLGFIPRVEIIEGKIVRGFKVLIGGGLGAIPSLAKTAFEFLPADKIIPFTESLLRVFDRHGERNNRNKARLKFLLNQIGLEELLRLTALEQNSLQSTSIPIAVESTVLIPANSTKNFTTFKVTDNPLFHAWKNANVFAQKQNGWFGVFVQVRLGNISSDKARAFAAIASRYAQDDIRVTIGQSFLLRFVPGSALPALFKELQLIDLVSTGADAFADITSCPGTDTCNLGISNSTGVAFELEKTIREEFPELIASKDIAIKISGCMNSCGQHGLAQIGFHGSSVKSGNAVLPALQLLLGGGIVGSGEGRVAEKVIKFPSKRAPAVLRTLLADFRTNSKASEAFNKYYDRVGKNYFYLLLKTFADVSSLKDEEFIDWNQNENYSTAIGIGECAGVKIDLVATLLLEGEEALKAADENLHGGRYPDAIYKAYNSFIHAAKSLLLTKGIHVNSQHGIIADFEKEFESGFRERILKLNVNAPTKEFATEYINDAQRFYTQANLIRNEFSQTITN